VSQLCAGAIEFGGADGTRTRTEPLVSPILARTRHFALVRSWYERFRLLRAGHALVLVALLGCSPDEYASAREGPQEEMWLEKLGDGAGCIPDDRVHCCAMQNRGPDTPWHCVDWCVDKDWPAVVEQRVDPKAECDATPGCVWLQGIHNLENVGELQEKIENAARRGGAP